MNVAGGYHARLRDLSVAALFTLLAACGGGSSSGSSPPPPVTPPPATLQSIAVTPDGAWVASGSTQQFKATGTYSDNATADLTNKVTWSSANEYIGRFYSDSPGLALAVTFGTTVVTAKLGSVSGSASLTVVPALIGIVITPNPVYSRVGRTLYFQATAVNSDGSMGGSVIGQATWASSDPSVATVDSNGRATGISLGTTTITASVGRIIASASLSITTGDWIPTAPIWPPRSNHTATLLPSGWVLVAAGAAPNGGQFAALYDPGSGTWAPTGDLSSPRLAGFTATLLPDGTVLVVGGFAGGTETLSGAELYDFSARTWSTTGSLPTTLCGHTATLLPNGKVLVAGGSNDFNAGPPTSAAQLYDPATGTWAPTGDLITARRSHSATLLPNGTVLVAGGVGLGGYLSSAELYDPVAGTWSATGSLPVAVGNGQTLTLLSNSQVLVTGGQDSRGSLSGAELYDPVAGTWSTTGSLSIPRTFHTASLLPNGKVLVAGGETLGSGVKASAEIYDPAAGTWSPTGSLITGRASHTATTLSDGSVLAVGGVVDSQLDMTSSAELYW